MYIFTGKILGNNYVIEIEERYRFHSGHTAKIKVFDNDHIVIHSFDRDFLSDCGEFTLKEITRAMLIEAREDLA